MLRVDPPPTPRPHGPLLVCAAARRPVLWGPLWRVLGALWGRRHAGQEVEGLRAGGGGFAVVHFSWDGQGREGRELRSCWLPAGPV